MEQDEFIKTIQGDPEIESELTWYRAKYMKHPFLIFFNTLFLEMRILLPPSLGEPEATHLLLLTILLQEYDIEQGILEGTYRIHLEKFGYLDEIEDISSYMQILISAMVLAYYESNEEGETDKLMKHFQQKAHKWNWHAYVKQEHVINILGEHLEEAGLQVDMDKRMLPEVIHDFYRRIDRKRLSNLDKFLSKSEDILESEKEQKTHARFFVKFLQEVRNGGENLHTIKDVIPHYTGLKFN